MMLPTARPRSPWVPPERWWAGGGGGERRWRGGRGGWAAWRRRVLAALRDRAHRARVRDRAPLTPHQIHLIRLESRLGGAWDTPGWVWAREGRGSPPGWRAPLHLPAFQLPPRFHATPAPHTIHFSLEADAGARSGRGPSSARPGAWGAAGTWGAAGAGAAVLALAALVLLARALERCRDKRLVKLLRRRSNEWFTPDVLATSGGTNDEPAEPRPLGSELPSEAPSGDPPPPYSECAAEPFTPPKPPAPGAPGATRAGPGDEPPPPYSACYVAFSNPKDGLPSVHFYNGQRQLLTSEPSGAPETDGTLQLVGCDGTEVLERGVEDGEECLERSSQVSDVASATSSRVPVA